MILHIFLSFFINSTSITKLGGIRSIFILKSDTLRGGDNEVYRMEIIMKMFLNEMLICKYLHFKLIYSNKGTKHVISSVCLNYKLACPIHYCIALTAM